MDGIRAQEVRSFNFCSYCGLNSGQSEYCCEACRTLDSGFKKLTENNVATIDSTFLYLDHPENQSLYNLSDKKREFKFFIRNIQCSSCVHLLEKIPEYNADCLVSRLNIGTSELHIQLNSVGKLSDIALLIENLGYEAEIIKSTEDVHTQIQSEQRNDLKRIAITAACAGNIMLFSVPIYSGSLGDLLTLFKVLNFLLFLPVVTYSALPFYRGAWTSLKLKKVHIDLPIAIALLAGFFFSVFNLVTGSDQFYFDSTASFLFLILVARFFVKKTQQKFLTPQNLKSYIKNETYTVNSNFQSLAENIKTDDMLEVRQGQIVPVDGVLKSELAMMDTSYMSGESIPLTFTHGMKVFAGYRLMSPSIQMTCQKKINETRIAELLKNSYQNLITKSQYLNLADRLAQKLILIVFTIAVVYLFTYGFLFDFKTAFDRALALIVVACPCALAFGSPLTLAMAYKKAHLKGITVRNPDVFEKISDVKNIFFDKTGTLTDGHLDISHTWPETVSEQLKYQILELEKISYHPIAFALRKAWGSQNESHPQIEIRNHTEIFGVGMAGYIGPDYYEIKGIPDQMFQPEADMAIALHINNVVQCRIYFRDHIRPESIQTIEYLKSLNIQIFLLSGDKNKKTRTVGALCGIPSENVFSELYPEDKENIIARYSNTLMIGDGVNDSPAMSKSDVSIAVQGSIEAALNTSDVFFLRSGLRPLIDMFSIHKSIHSTLKRNLTLSLVYNFTAGTLALLGYINPLWAAILMPISSVIVVASTAWGFSK
jgi:Cu+-exporting ATPase